MDNLIQLYNLAGEQQRCLYKSGTIWRCNLKYVTGGWLTYPSEKTLVSWHYYSQYIENQKLFQTTNQVQWSTNNILVYESHLLIQLNAHCGTFLSVSVIWQCWELAVPLIFGQLTTLSDKHCWVNCLTVGLMDEINWKTYVDLCGTYRGSISAVNL